MCPPRVTRFGASRTRLKQVPAPHTRLSTRRELIVLITGAAVTAGLFVALAATVWHINEPVGLDRSLARLGLESGEEGPLGAHPRLARAAERLGSRGVVGLATAALVALAALWRDWIGGLVALASPVACFVLTEYVAKPLINQPSAVTGRGFPSGHTAGVTAVALSALILVYRRRGGGVTAVCAPLAIAPVLAVGLGLLALRFHYPTDVAGGGALGGTVVFTLTVILSSPWLAPGERRQPGTSPGTEA
jgi:membrane-associated phospholipid phosphatase